MLYVQKCSPKFTTHTNLPIGAQAPLLPKYITVYVFLINMETAVEVLMTKGLLEEIIVNNYELPSGFVDLFII